MRKREDSAEVFRITGAREGLSADIRGRQRRYAISMTIRTVCFLLAITLWHVQMVLAVIALVASAVLPYVAVVIANAGRTDRPSLPPAFVPAPTRNMLEPGRVPRPPDQPDRRDEPYADGHK
jgi:hypothetical protein